MGDERAGDALFSLQDYLDCVMVGQHAEQVQRRKNAGVVLTMGKSLSVDGISLAGRDFFLKC